MQNEKERKKRGFIKRGGAQMKGLGQLMALNAYLMAGSEKEKILWWVQETKGLQQAED